MNIFYILTTLAIYILIMLLHKNENKQNIISWLAISAILVLCYNIFICVILSFVNILCTLQNLSISNIIVMLVLLALQIKTKKTQKYYLKISDIIVAAVFLIIVVFISYKQYGFPFNIKYEITDGSTHYFFAEQFYENSTLLYNKQTGDLLGIYSSDFRLPGAYINEGILFKVFDGLIAKTDIFILFDIFVLYLSALLFYHLLKASIKDENKKLQILAFAFAIMYMLGYQLNSMLYGYVYLSLALSLIIAFILLMAQNQKEEKLGAVNLLFLSTVSFGICFSYAYFIPIIYISIIIETIIKSVKNKEKILSNKNLNLIMYLVIIPTLLGLGYFMILPIISGIKPEISTIGTPGEIYENYITNYLPFIPIIIISAVVSIKNKNKQINFEAILFAFSIIFAIMLFIGNKLSIVSEYYFFKAYYIIWLLTLYNAYVAVTYIVTSQYKQARIITYTYTAIYIITILTSTLILKKNIGINDIFLKNAESIQNEWSTLKSQELEIIQTAKGLKEAYILPSIYRGRMSWMSVLFNNQHIYIDYVLNNHIDIEKWLNEKQEKYYIAYYQEYKQLETNEVSPNENSDQYKIIYNDDYAFILERK